MKHLSLIAPISAFACSLLFSGCFSRAPHPPATPIAGAGAPGSRSPSTGRPSNGPKPYKQIITSEAKTTSGMFKTHQVGEKLYFEIPRNELDKDMLLVGRFAKTGATTRTHMHGRAYAGDEFTESVLRWQKQGNKIILRTPVFYSTADTSLPIYKAVSDANQAPIIAIFNVETYSEDSAAVIDVTRLYIGNIPEFISLRGGIDQNRSYIESARAFPTNVEIEATQTIVPQTGGSQEGVQPAVSVVAHWSMIHLPEKPMQSRLLDHRVGYFATHQIDYGTNEHRSASRLYIHRWRLEKKDPNAELSEPVKPIIYYIDPATPDQWKPWIKKGVEAWQPAFEAAGFKNAIVAMDPPDDPDWSAEDVRNTVVRWLPSPIRNAQGPHVHDPRTGEILNGSIRFFHNIMSLQSSWYFTQVSPLDKRAQKLPFPDSLMGRLLQHVVTHEVGHTLGLEHNMKASSQYPLDSLRSRTWLRKMGHTPSIMDYVRFNYVAQPEDSIPPEDLVPRVGPYDKFAIMWGYKPIANSRTPEQEKPTLNSWARMQDTIPWYRYSTIGVFGIDPGDQAEAVGDADPVRATELGLRNIKRVVPMLIPALIKTGENNNDLAGMYEALISQWFSEIMHVVDIVGGAESREKYGDQPGPRFIPLPRERQRAVVRFINDNVFNTPTYLLDQEVLRRIEPEGALSRLGSIQSMVLGSLLVNNRLARMVEFAALSPRAGTTYTVSDLLTDVRNGIWSELDEPTVSIGVFRRSLQNIYIDNFNDKITPPTPFNPFYNYDPPITPDASAQIRGELRALDTKLRLAIPRAADSATRLHIIHMRDRIKKILAPKEQERN